MPMASAIPQLPQEALFTAVTVPGRVNCLADVYAALKAGASATAVDERGRSALHIAAYENEDAEAVAAVIPALVTEGAAVQMRNLGDDTTPLHVAACNENAAAAAAAIKALVAADGSVAAADSQGRQPLHWVCFNRSGPVAAAAVQALVDAGAQTDAADAAGGLQPLHLAAFRCENAAAAEAAIQALAAAGGSVSAKSSKGGEPLHYCGQGSSAEAAAAAVRALVKAGGSVQATCNRGGTPLVSRWRWWWRRCWSRMLVASGSLCKARRVSCVTVCLGWMNSQLLNQVASTSLRAD